MRVPLEVSSTDVSSEKESEEKVVFLAVEPVQPRLTPVAWVCSCTSGGRTSWG